MSAPAASAGRVPLRARAPLRAGAAALALLCLAGDARAAATGESIGRTSFLWNPRIFADLGVQIVDVDATAEPIAGAGVAFAAVPPSDVAPRTQSPTFQHFDSGALHHAGGFALRLPDGEEVSFRGFVLRVADPPWHWELLDAAGVRSFLVREGMPWPAPESGELWILNLDVGIAPELAARLGRPALAGTFVGAAHVAVLALPGSVAAVEGVGCDPTVTPNVDVAVDSITTLSQFARDGVRVAVAPGVQLSNVGESAVEWFQTIAPDSPVGPHPFLVLHFYRLLGTRLEPLGRSDAKHAFRASNGGCGCAAGHLLFSGCNDFYGAFTNSDPGVFGPRDEIAAFTAAWTRVGSHFDGVPVDDVRDHFAADHDAFEHRLVLPESELATPGARYFIEAVYVVFEDDDLWNNMAHFEVVPAFGGSVWTFATVGGLLTGSILDRLVDPGSPPQGSGRALLDTGEGRLEVAVRTTSQGGGVFRYEYAVANHDFDRQVRSLVLPRPEGVAVSGLSFADGDLDPGNDWSGAVSTHLVAWTAPAGAGLDWGTLHSFGFDAQATPASGSARLDVREPGAPSALFPAILAPGAAFASETLVLHGVAQGGSVSLVVEGVLVGVPTLAGEDAAQVALHLAAAVNASAPLSALGIAAWSEGAALFVTAALGPFTSADAGITDSAAIAAVSRTGAALLALALAVSASVSTRRGSCAGAGR